MQSDHVYLIKRLIYRAFGKRTRPRVHQPHHEERSFGKIYKNDRPSTRKRQRHLDEAGGKPG